MEIVFVFEDPGLVGIGEGASGCYIHLHDGVFEVEGQSRGIVLIGLCCV